MLLHVYIYIPIWSHRLLRIGDGLSMLISQYVPDSIRQLHPPHPCRFEDFSETTDQITLWLWLNSYGKTYSATVSLDVFFISVDLPSPSTEARIVKNNIKIFKNAHLHPSPLYPLSCQKLALILHPWISSDWRSSLVLWISFLKKNLRNQKTSIKNLREYPHEDLKKCKLIVPRSSVLNMSWPSSNIHKTSTIRTLLEYIMES